MGRTGGSHSGGGHSHSSHSSSGRSHSSHSSSRSFSSAGSRTGGSSSRSSYGYGGTRAPRVRNSVHVYGGGFYGGSPANPAKGILIWLAMTAIMIMLIMAISTSNGSGIKASTVNRERLDGGSFTESCVDDQLGWIKGGGMTEKAMGARLQPFWDATGVQPYVVMLPYGEGSDDPDYRYQWADDYYSENIGRDDAMLLAYFDAEPDGNWEMVCGNLTGSVLDPEAKEIFWSVLDSKWNDLDNSVPEALEKAFSDAGRRIMAKTTTGADVAKWAVILCCVIAAGITAVAVMNARRRHKAEEAAETERILNAPLESLGADDPLVDKYGGGE